MPVHGISDAHWLHRSPFSVLTPNNFYSFVRSLERLVTRISHTNSLCRAFRLATTCSSEVYVKCGTLHKFLDVIFIIRRKKNILFSRNLLATFASHGCRLSRLALSLHTTIRKRVSKCGKMSAVIRGMHACDFFFSFFFLRHRHSFLATTELHRHWANSLNFSTATHEKYVDI